MTSQLLHLPTAKCLAAVLIVAQQGQDVLDAEQPLSAVDQGDTIFVSGTPYSDTATGLVFCSSYMVFKKDDGEILAFGLSGSQPVKPEEEEHWRSMMSQADYERVFGPVKPFIPDPAHPSPSLYMTKLFGGGLINGPAVAADYAAILIATSAGVKPIDSRELIAVEHNGFWHVAARTSPTKDLVVLERSTGRIVSVAS